MSSDKVSVVIPCYNEEGHIRKCLGSILDQTLRPFEVIIIDDGSTDRTREIVRTYPVRLLEQNHDGPGKARNYGAREASGDILVFVDADMFFDKHFLERLIAPIIAGTSFGTFNKEEFVGNPENPLAVCWNYEHVGCPDRRIPGTYPNEAVIYRAILRSKFFEAGGFDISVGYEDDATLYSKLKQKSVVAPGAISYHDNPGSLGDIYRSARWMGRTQTLVRKPVALLKHSVPFSIVTGIINSIRFGLPQYIVFKIVYDYGILTGGITRRLSGTSAK